jgi:DNA-binding NarL/FixJ family response regulator
MQSSSVVRVLVVEDYLPFREFICKELARWPTFQVICEVSDGQQGVQKAKELQPDLVLLDIGLPTLNGISAARQILKFAPNSKIIFVTQESSPTVVQEAIKLGAQGYVVKARVATDLLAALTAVLGGNQFLSPGINRHDPAENEHS